MLPKPALIFHGTDDPITSYQASEQFAKSAGSMATLKLWPDMRHETHNEFGKEEVLDYLYVSGYAKANRLTHIIEYRHHVLNMPPAHFQKCLFGIIQVQLNHFFNSLLS